MNIRPTLFIGLGSSGINIIKEFRRFMFEQFSMAGLPIIEYIGLETDADYDLSDELLPHTFALADYEKIQLIKCTVPSAKAVDSIKGSELSKWIDSSVTAAPSFAVVKGAQNVRMLGRLALWMNATAVKTAIVESHNRIMNRSDDTTSILSSASGGVFSGTQIDDGFDVYMLGTLCGGSCSGMFIDIAYMVQRLLGVHDMFVPEGMHPNDPGIYGMFTVMDTALTEIGNNKRKAANCWAALLELDYYMDPEVEYDFNLPGMLPRDPTTNSPLNIVQLVCRQNLLRHTFQGGGLANFDGAELNKMVALKVFHNMFSGMDREIAAITVNATGEGVLGVVPQNRQLHTRTLISFGTSALWNPRHQHAEAFACKKGQELCEKWGRSLDPARSLAIQTQAEVEWQRIRDAALNIMLMVPGGPSVRQELNSVAQAAQAHLASKSLGALGAFLAGFPSENPVRLRLAEGGDLWQTMAAQVQGAEHHLKTQIERLLDDKINNINPMARADTSSIGSLPEMQEFIQNLTQEIKSDLEMCPPGPPSWDYRPLSFPAEAEALSRSGWLRMINVAERGIAEAKKRVHSHWSETLEEHMKETRRYFARPLFTNIVDQVLPPFVTRINNAMQALGEAKDKLADSFRRVTSLSQTNYENIIRVSNYPTLDQHVQELKQLFVNAAADGAVMGTVLSHWQRVDDKSTGRWLDLFTISSDKLPDLLRYSFARWALANTQDGTDPAQLALDRFQTTDRLRQLAEMSFPFVPMRADFSPGRYAAPVDFISGSGNTAGLQAHIASFGPGMAFNTYPSPLKNIVVFYRQLAPFYLDDLHVAGAMELLYNELGQQNLHTHFRQGLEFDKHYALRRQAAKDKVWAVQHLFPNGVFRVVKTPRGTRYAFAYSLPGGRPVPPLDVTDEAGQDRLCRLLAESSDAGRAAKQMFDSSVKTFLEDKGKSAVYAEWERLVQEWGQAVMNNELTQHEADTRNDKVRRVVEEAFGNG